MASFVWCRMSCLVTRLLLMGRRDKFDFRYGEAVSMDELAFFSTNRTVSFPWSSPADYGTLYECSEQLSNTKHF